MPQDPPRTSLEPLIPGSRDERYSDGDATPTGATDISAERRRARRGSLDSVDDMPRLQRGLGDLAPSAGDKAAVYLLAVSWLWVVGH
jgi:hypothetical protein